MCSYYQGVAAGHQVHAEKAHSMYLNLAARHFELAAERDALEMELRELKGEFRSNEETNEETNIER